MPDEHETSAITLDCASDAAIESPRLETVRDGAPTNDREKAGGPATSRGAEPLTVEADLERRIVEAELAGRTTIADVLARRLEAHRAARAAGNVVAITSAKKSS